MWAGGFVLGEVLYLQSMVAWGGALAVGLAGSAGLLWAAKSGRRAGMHLLPFFICLMFVTAGGLRMGDEIRVSERIRQMGLDGRYLDISGTIRSIQETREYTRFVLEDCRTKEKGEQIRGVQVYLKGGDWQSWKIGHQVTVSGTMRLFDPARNPGGFDSRNYYLAQKLDYRMGADSMVLQQEGYSRYPDLLYRIGKFGGTILEAITDGTDTGIYRAAVLGDKTQLDEGIRELYQRNGIAHLLAISGVHLSLVGMAVYRLFRKMGIGFTGSCLIGAAFIISYGILTGASASMVRAAVMLICGFLAACLGRTCDRLSALGLAAILLLWESPYLITQAGFQLSFGAILGIGWLIPCAERFFYREEEAVWIGWLKKGLIASGCVQVMTTPVILYHYFQLPLYGVFLNLIVIPLMGYVIAAGIAGICLGAVDLTAGRFAVGSGHVILMGYEWLCRQTDRLPWSSLVIGQPAVWQILCYYSLLLILWRRMTARNQTDTPPGNKQKIAVVLVTVVFTGLLVPVRSQALQICFLDVGQGDGVCMRKGSFTVLVDGGSTDEAELGAFFLEPYLKSQGITTIDYAFVSHGDADHISGLVYLLEESREITIKNLVLPILGKGEESCRKLDALAQKKGVSVNWMATGDYLEAADVKIRCLYPAGTDPAADRNEQSVVLRVDYGDFGMLLTGDMSEAGETALLQRNRASLAGISILKLAHHGSRFSNSEEWLRTIRPRFAVGSYGTENRYGHPHHEVLERLEAEGIPMSGTAENGAITYRTDGRQIRWSTFRR